jgi:hypothetical protein
MYSSDKQMTPYTQTKEFIFPTTADIVVPVLLLIKHYAMKVYGECMYRSTFS